MIVEKGICKLQQHLYTGEHQGDEASLIISSALNI